LRIRFTSIFGQVFCVVLLGVFFGADKTWAQVSTTVGSIGNSPLSRFGVGELMPEGNTQQQALGGAGSALSNGENANFLNPAQLYYARQVNLEAGVRVGTKYAKSAEGKLTSGRFSPLSLSLVLPIARPITVGIGLRQFSAIDYSIQVQGITTGTAGTEYNNYYTGGGSLSQAFVGTGIRITDGLTIGAQGTFWFGTLSRYSDVKVDLNAITREVSTRVQDVQAKLGAAYRFKMLGHRASVSITGELPNGLSTKEVVVVRRYNNTGALTNLDTTAKEAPGTLEAPRSLRLGLAFEKPKNYVFAFDLARDYWTKVALSGLNTPLLDGYRASLGTEWIPNFNGQSYFSFINYRAGVYARQLPYELDGARMNDIGMSIGLGLPILRKDARYTRPLVNTNFSIGRRSGPTASGSYRETYINFTLGLVLNDSQWFVRYKID
jgi:hypothetical protein